MIENCIVPCIVIFSTRSHEKNVLTLTHKKTQILQLKSSVNMDYCRILTNIFNTTFTKDETKDFVNCIDSVNLYLDETLENFQEKFDENRENEIIGAKTVVWDIENADNIANLVKISKDRLSILSQSAFSTLKANACIIAGCYQYEVQLKSKGVMQIGGCSSTCKFTQDTGVGDTKYSYGLGNLRWLCT